MIQVLDDKTINKIAAGEVVERPAAVIRELVENSIDAKATVIQIELESGGKSLIRIRDNGIGMNEMDAVLCLQRHATSKIRSDKDLFSIRSLGFRGEAVPSIAAVSRFELITKPKDASSGTKVLVEGGNKPDVIETGAPTGTQITARNLFFNVPARKNFLRTDSTELGHCLEAVIREMLIRPHIDIEVKHNRSQVIRATPATTLETRAIQLLGNQARGLIPVEFQQGHFRIKGAISPVGVHRATGQNNSYLYVNDRYVKDTALRRAIREAYQGLIPKGRYPTVILCVHLPPSDVDVNVHPAKTEVRFKNVKELCALLVRNLRGRLQEHGIKRSTQVRPKAIPPAAQKRQEQVPLWEPKTPVKEIVSALPNTQQQALLVAEDVQPILDSSSPNKRVFPKNVVSFQADKPVFSESESVESLAPTVFDRVLGTWPIKTEQEMLVSDLLPVASFSELRVLGQLSTTYILCEGNGELVIIDQHAAHERITLFELMQNVNRQGAWGQRLLSPILIELNPARYHSIVPHLKVLERYGLELEPFGGSTLALRQVPPFLGVSDWTTLIEDVADDIALGGSGTPLEERLQLKLATTACHASIRAGDRLSPFRMQELLEELDGVDFGVCAHGRPVAIRIDTKELEKRFHRS